MILSASRRTDIPAFYADWFLNRLREGYVLVRNPMNYHQVSEVKLTPENVDCIVFWTKNPSRLIEKLPEIDNLGYHYYFQFTLNPYDKSIEENLPGKNVLVETFKRLSDQCGPQKVIWRYDPIFVGDDYPVDYHAEQFACLANQLEGYTEKCIFSFLDPYAKIQKAIKQLGIEPPDTETMGEIAKLLAEIALPKNIKLETCAEEIDLAKYGISHTRCIDGDLIERIIGCPLSAGKDPAQRSVCGCVSSIDIGSFNTCAHGCKYCYANYGKQAVLKNQASHNPNSPLIFGELDDRDIVKPRKEKDIRSLKQPQQSLF